MKGKNLHIVILCFALVSCIETFNPTIEQSERELTLVVDGRITTEVGPYTVKLTSSFPVNSELTAASESGAQVTIEEEDGNTAVLVEGSPGVYRTAVSDIQGQVGKRYRLSIRLFDGLEYQSSWQEILPTPEIDNFWHEPTINETQEDDIPGTQLFLNTKGVAGESEFFRWEILEAWKYEAPLVSDSIYMKGGIVLPKPPEDIHKTCWKQSRVGNIMINSVSDLSGTEISNHPLTFVSPDSARFNIRYTALVKQFAIGVDEYDFWKNLENTNENVGSIYDNQPFEILGNVRSTSGEKRGVLGYFSAYDVSEQRIFVDRADFPNGFLPDPEFSDCNILIHSLGIMETIQQLEQKMLDLIANGIRIFYELPDPSRTVYHMTTRTCGDCEVYGGSTSPPTFWED